MNPKKNYLNSIGTASTNFGTPSSAWQSYGATKTIGTSGSPVPKTTPTMTPSNTSATGTNTTKITSPAGQNYMNTVYGGQTNPVTTPTTSPAPTTKDESYKNTPEYKSYLKYQREKENPTEASDARKAYEASQQRYADKQSEREARADELRREQRDILDASGGLKSGAIDSANMQGRRANDELSRLALEESAAGRTAGVASSVYAPYLEQQQADAKPLSYEEAQSLGVAYGTTIGEAKVLGKIPDAPTPEGYTLSEGQARYDADGNIIASRGKTYAPGTGSGAGVGTDGSSVNVSPQAQSIIDLMNTTGGSIDDYIKGNSITSQNLRNQVIAGLNAQGGLTDKATEILQEGKNVVDKMLTDQSYNALGGYSTKFGGQFSTAFGDAKAMAQQLESILARDNLGLLKGAMSDNDLKFIKSMSSGFDGEGVQSEGFIKGKLEEIQTKLQNKLASTGGTGGGQAPQMQLPNGTIVYLQSDGTYSE